MGKDAITYKSLTSNHYNQHDDIQGLDRIKEPRPCAICGKVAYHVFKHKIHNGYKIATLPVCSESCTFDVGEI